MTTDTNRLIDRLADPAERSIENIWTTGRSNDDGEVLLIVATHYDRHQKQIKTTIHTATRSDDGFLTRSFVLYGTPSTDTGWIIARQPVGRFSATRARNQHQATLLRLHRDMIAAEGAVGAELLGLFRDANPRP